MCCVVGVIKDSVLALEWRNMLCISVGCVMDVVLSV